MRASATNRESKDSLHAAQGGDASPTSSLIEVYRRLDAMHGGRHWHWWPDADPFEVIVGAILVQSTAWTNVERALERLRAAGVLKAEAMVALPQPELEELVRPSGQYRQKAKKLRAFLELVEAHGSLEALLALPKTELRRRLLATWGIGPETADCIVLYAARQPAFTVDTYLIRLFTRLNLGPVQSADYDTWQQFCERHLAPDRLPPLSALVPGGEGTVRDFWARYRAEIVLHCKHVCLKNRPKCGKCLLRELCPAATGFDG